jgi:hypothetical protein
MYTAILVTVVAFLLGGDVYTAMKFVTQTGVCIAQFLYGLITWGIYLSLD